jgi:hypothetical protein
MSKETKSKRPKRDANDRGFGDAINGKPRDTKFLMKCRAEGNLLDEVRYNNGYDEGLES